MALFLRGKKSDLSGAFYTGPLFLQDVRFFYWSVFGVVGGKYEPNNVQKVTSNHMCTLHFTLCVLLIKFANMTAGLWMNRISQLMVMFLMTQPY